MDVQPQTIVAPLPLSKPTLIPSTIAKVTTFAGAISSFLRIVQRYIDQRMNEAVKVAVQIQSDRLRDEAQEENDEFLKTIDENMHKIIEKQVKERVKTSYVVSADLLKMELKKILIEKLEGNKSIYRSIEQMNFYKALVDAYESNKIILDTCEDIVTLKRRRDDDANKDQEPSARSDRGSKRRREGKEPQSASALKDKATRSAGKSTQGVCSHVYSKHRIIIVTELKIVEWRLQEASHSRHRRYVTASGSKKADNLTVKECFAFKVSLRLFIKSIIIQRRVEDLQLGVKSYQKKLNLTRPDTYQSDLKCKQAYIVYSNPRGFIYQNKDKQNRLIQIDELHKFSNGTLTDVHTALDDRLKGIQMNYLPQTIWRKSDKEREASMIQAIVKQLKIRRIMRSLKRFVGERLYEGDFRMLQRTI
nr:hypothetical protein [Tanacetum cinerariifolium]